MATILAYALAGLAAWLFLATIIALAFGAMIPSTDRHPQPFEGSGDDRGGGVDQ